MAIPLRQSTASQEIPLGPFLDSVDGNTQETGLTIANTDIQVWKAGATALVSKTSGGATHMAQGVYSAVLDATDTDTVGPLVVFVHLAGALAVRLECMVLTQANYDAAVAGSSAVAANVTQWNGDAVNNLVSGNVSATAVTVGDKTGYSLSGAGAQAIWDVLTSALITVGSVGKLLVDMIDVAISTRLATSGYTTPPTVEAIADQVWDEAISGHLGAGSTGAALNAAGSAGDPWTTPLPGAYGVGTAGNIVGTALDEAVSTRAIPADVPSSAANASAVRTELTTELGRIDVDVSTRSVPGDVMDLTAGAVDAVLDEIVEGSVTMRQALRLFAASLGGKLSGAATSTITIRDLGDTKDRVTATVDSDGNRAAVTLDLT